MFIELTEYLRCVADHPPAWLVLAPDRMEGRHVMEGVIGCPTCHAEYRIVDGVVRFGDPPALAAVAMPDAQAVQALIGLESPGGCVALVGSAACLADRLGGLLEGVHLVTINGPPAPVLPTRSALVTASVLPIRDRMLRGVVVGGEAVPAMMAEARRVVLPGQRVVALTEQVPPVPGLESLAQGQGMWVGRYSR